MMSLPIKEIEEFVRKRTENIDFVTHNWGHVIRATKGAVWFVKVLGGSKEEEELAYVAGLLHDIVRPESETIDHAQASADEAEKILKRFGVGGEPLRKIVKAIQDHRKPVAWESPLHQSVYLADKILEQMGAYVIFRRCVYVSEVVEYRDMPWQEAVRKQFRLRLERFQSRAFPERFHNLVEYQYSWPLRFEKAYISGNEWALALAEYAWKRGKENAKVEDIIRGFKPEGPEAEKIKQEAIEYLDGKLFKGFEALV